MSRTLHVDVDLTVDDDADDMGVADAVLEGLHAAAELGVFAVDGDGVQSIDGTEPKRSQ